MCLLNTKAIIVSKYTVSTDTMPTFKEMSNDQKNPDNFCAAIRHSIPFRLLLVILDPIRSFPALTTLLISESHTLLHCIITEGPASRVTRRTASTGTSEEPRKKILQKNFMYRVLNIRLLSTFLPISFGGSFLLLGWGKGCADGRQQMFSLP
jgi:hypothetical protein